MESITQEKGHPRTLVQALIDNAKVAPNKVCLTWLNDKCRVAGSLTYAKLLESSLRVAAQLLKHGVAEGDRVMIAYPFGLEVVAGIYGCMIIGVIPCSVYPPNMTSKSQAKFSFQQFNNQIHDAGAKFALTTRNFKFAVRAFGLATSHRAEAVTWLSTDDLQQPMSSIQHLLEGFQCSPETPALIQYSSGSTGEPKGVVLSHGAIIHNLRSIRAGCNFRRNDNTGDCLSCVWLPQYHDYALIAFIIGACYSARDPCIMCSPIDFIRNPLLWADMIEMFQPKKTAGPNFAYGLLCRRLKAVDRRLNATNLSVTSMAGEPIHPGTITRMIESGFPADSICPSYGMAEMCVFATGCFMDAANDFQTISIDGAVRCGECILNEANGTKIVIANSDDHNVITEHGTIGEICIRSPSMALGYWNKPALTKERFQSKLSDGKEYFRTGDLGRIVNGHIFVCGRLKELIIINGRNVYPTDIEREVEAGFTEIVRPGSSVAFQHADSDAGLALELRRNVDPADAAPVLNASTIRRLVSDSNGVDLGYICLLKHGSVPKTTSGKLRRTETRRIAIASEWKRKDIFWTWSATQNSTKLTSDSKTEREENDIRSVLSVILGPEYDEKLSWEVLGVSSMAFVELQNLVSDELSYNLKPTFQDDFPTPRDLRLHLEQASCLTFETSQQTTFDSHSSQIGWTMMAWLQGIGIIMQLLLIAASFIPAYQFGKFMTGIDNLNETTEKIRWQWVPLIIPVWMASFTFVVIASKWIVIGRYRVSQVPVPSIYYVRWWFVDRLLHTWEIWLGSFLKDTPFLWLFYVLLGAEIAPSVKVKEFLRECDLIKIGAHSKIDHDIVCRRFRRWSTKDDMKLAFREIQIGDHCVVEGLVSPGCSVGDYSTIEKMAALQEGSKVPPLSVAQGSPAMGIVKSPDATQKLRETKREFVLVIILKTLWLVLELYMFSASLVFSQWLLHDLLPTSFRYTPLLYWCLFILLQTVLSMVLALLLKWALIGKKQPKSNALSASMWSEMRDWCVDYHYGCTLYILSTIADHSKLNNAYWRALGMNIDWTSHAYACCIWPSQVDLIEVKRSFLSTAWFETENNQPIRIVDSSLGFHTILRGGADIRDAQTPPMATLDGPKCGEDREIRHQSLSRILLTEFFYLCMLGAIFVSAIPAYELFKLDDTGVSLQLGFSVVKLAGAMLLQTLVWMLSYWVLQNLVFDGLGRVRSVPLYTVYLTFTYNFIWVSSLLHLACGSEYMNAYLRFLGATTEGRMLFFSRAYEIPMMTFRDRTILDRCTVYAHAVVYDALEVSPITFAGVLHEGSLPRAGTDMTGAIETGPYRFTVPKMASGQPLTTVLDSSGGETMSASSGWPSDAGSIVDEIEV